MNANDSLREHTCTDNYYRFGPILLITDGIKALCEKFECFWLMDVIASYQPTLMAEEFQVWTLEKIGENAAIIKCTDGNDKVLKSQMIEYTDFRADKATIWVEGNTALLPSEH